MMMKFRVWDIETKTMYYDRSIEFSEIGKWRSWKFTFLDKDGNIFVANPIEEASGAVLMQSTGIKDKNDKEIWEGDIMRVNERFYYTVMVGKCEVDNGDGGALSFGPYLNPINDKYPCLFTLYDEYQIIGNIYEDPELLEK